MQIPFLSAPLTHQHASIVFDIGSGSVAAAVIMADASHPTRILSSKRVTLSNEERSEDQLMRAITEALAAAGTAALDAYTRSPNAHALGPVQSVYAGIHAPWSQSVTRDSQITLSSPTRISAAHIARASSEAKKNDPAPAADRRIYERAVVRVELNGYPTAAPEGKLATTIRVVALESTASASFIDAITAALATLLPGRTPVFNSAILAYSTVVRQLASHDSSYTFLDIASEASACSVIRSGLIVQQGMVPAGTRTLLSAAAEASAQPIESVYSMIRMIADGTCSDAGCDAIAAALSHAEPIYLRAVGEVFSTMSAEQRLPNQLVIAIHPGMALWAERFFERLDFGQFTLTGKPFGVQIVSTDILTGLALFAGESAPDTGLAVQGALVHIHYA